MQYGEKKQSLFFQLNEIYFNLPSNNTIVK